MSFNRFSTLVNTRTFDIVRASSDSVIDRKTRRRVLSGPFVGHTVDCCLTIEQRVDPETMRVHEPSASIRIYIEHSDGEIDETMDVSSAIGRSATGRLIDLFDQGHAASLLEAITHPRFVMAINAALGYGDDAMAGWNTYANCAERWRKENAKEIGLAIGIRAANGYPPVLDDDDAEQMIADADEKFARDNDLPAEDRASND